MGKVEEQNLHLQQQQQAHGARSRRNGSSSILCERCSMGLSRFGREFSLKCVVLLIFSLAVFLPAMFWVLPLRSTGSGFDAKDEIKLRAVVQAYFRLQTPVSALVPQIERLEYEIYEEIAVPFTKVAILSMHQDGASNWTNVVFGVLSNPAGSSMNPVSLSLLKPSFLELFFQQSNLILTNSTFGQPSSFEILKFPGGITVFPEPFAVWQRFQILFNFTLHNSIYEIKENLVELKAQLKYGLHLRPYENVHVELTNNIGSTIDPPVTVQAAVVSDLGILLPPRLKQLARTITGSPAKNLGLDNSVFGRVKEVSLSSYLNHTLHPAPPTPSPSPAPEQNDYAGPSIAPTPSPSPSYSPAPSVYNYPYSPSPGNGVPHSLPPIASTPAPLVVGTWPPIPCPGGPPTLPPSPSHTSHSYPIAPSAFRPLGPSSCPPHVSPSPQSSSHLSPSPSVSYGPSSRQDKGNVGDSVSPPLGSPSSLPSLSSFAIGPSYKIIWFFCGLLAFQLLHWS